MKSKPIFHLALATSLILLATRVHPQDSRLPQPCRVGIQAPAVGFWTWQANTHVKVYARSGEFTDEQLHFMQQALQNWNRVLGETASGVDFRYAGETVRELSCDDCLTIVRGAVFDRSKRHVTELKAYSAQRNQIINWATITVDPVLTSSKALANAIEHELGHNLGLLDCYSCKDKSTVMNQLKVVNKSNNTSGPTECDVRQVALAYRELKIRVRPSPPDRGLIDEGEEPEDDDTPIIIPKPSGQLPDNR